MPTSIQGELFRRPDKLGFEVRADMTVGGFRWLTVAPKAHRGLSHDGCHDCGHLQGMVQRPS